jgi:subtilisin-like proprotein convertase family protein
MDGRLAKHMLVRTSRVVDPWDATPTSGGGWKTNGAGFRFNPNYGFGVIDAGALAATSRLYYSSGPQVTRVLPVQAVNAAIPDNNPTGVTRTATVSGTTGSVPVEDIQLRIRANHTFKGDLTATLRSPFGTVHRVFVPDTGSTGNLDWTFNINGFWGENPQGTWSITLADTAASDTGTWTDFQLTFKFGGPSSRLGSNILTYNPANTDIQMNALWQARSYANVALPARPAVAAIPVGVGDLDRDGRSDILYQNGVNLFYQPMWGYTAKAPVVGIGALAANQVAFGVADINRDGLADVVVRNTVTGQVGYYNLNPAGSALGASVVIGTPPAGIVPFGVGDSTGDGQPDILMDKTTISRAVWIWQLQPGGAPFGFIFSGFQAAGFTLIGAGDLNFDGQPDFIARNNANGTVAGYTMNVLSISTISTLSPIPAGHTAFGAAAL